MATRMYLERFESESLGVKSVPADTLKGAWCVRLRSRLSNQPASNEALGQRPTRESAFWTPLRFIRQALARVLVSERHVTSSTVIEAFRAIDRTISPE